jgi:hypothetical protein
VVYFDVNDQLHLLENNYSVKRVDGNAKTGPLSARVFRHFLLI